jgi:hypothetical protein
MNYIDVAWISAEGTYPFRLVSELDDQAFETRKLEFFRSGTVGSASNYHATENTILGTTPVPSLAEICADPQFRGCELSSAEFELLWSQYGRPLNEHEVVEVIASGSQLPTELVGKQAVVLLAHQQAESPSYEVEFVAPGGGTVWQGALRREQLRAVQSE